MARFSLKIKKSVINDLEAIVSSTDRLRIIEHIESLAEVARPRDSEKLPGDERYCTWQGRFRILYTIDNQSLVIVEVVKKY